MTRSLKCQMINDQGGITSLPIHTCEYYQIAKLPTEGNCNFDIPCVGKCDNGVLVSILFVTISWYYVHGQSFFVSLFVRLSVRLSAG